MAEPEYILSPEGRRLAYHLSAGQGPTIVFCGGLRSDMDGSKALFLEDWARARNRAFLRFDYSGHGRSSGNFENGAIGDWQADTLAAVSLVAGKLVLVGSSMGGWQSLLLARALPGRIAGLITVAAAPDFTEDGWWNGFDASQRQQLARSGRLELPSEYGAPLVVTQRMISDGREHLVLRDPLPLPFPVRLLQGTDDADVDMSLALRLLAHASSPDMRLTLVDGADHRFSDADCLALIAATLEEVLERAT